MPEARLYAAAPLVGSIDLPKEKMVKTDYYGNLKMLQSKSYDNFVREKKTVQKKEDKSVPNFVKNTIVLAGITALLLTAGKKIFCKKH